MSEVLTIVARIEAAEGKTDLVKAALTKLIAPTLAEAGCMQYDLHQDNENPAVFMFFENWETREHWLQHNESAHIAALRIETEGAIASTVINQVTKV